MSVAHRLRSVDTKIDQVSNLLVQVLTRRVLHQHWVWEGTWWWNREHCVCLCCWSCCLCRCCSCFFAGAPFLVLLSVWIVDGLDSLTPFHDPPARKKWKSEETRNTKNQYITNYCSLFIHGSLPNTSQDSVYNHHHRPSWSDSWVVTWVVTGGVNWCHDWCWWKRGPQGEELNFFEFLYLMKRGHPAVDQRLPGAHWDSRESQVIHSYPTFRIYRLTEASRLRKGWTYQDWNNVVQGKGQKAGKETRKEREE